MRMDILTVREWKLFLISAFILLATFILIESITSFLESEIVTFLGGLVILAVYFIYPVWVGLLLRDMLSSQPHYTRRSNASLILDGCLIAVAYGAQEIRYQRGEASIFLGVIGVLGVVGIVRLASFPAHEIKSIELKRNAGLWEYVSEAFQMLYWPLGVLWMQPRINRIANKKTILISE
jgi:hypothetical protein